ncbi:hypothetical protein AB9K17_23955, partial [Salmonella enterica subsp. enterica serovar Kentucky]|uniref:hypothetical protein n=1 Tax=Salmonella enterica TaxID=28901 RepID=UPI003F4BADF5
TSSFLLLVAMPGATSSVLAPSSDALVPSSILRLGWDNRHACWTFDKWALGTASALCGVEKKHFGEV